MLFSFRIQYALATVAEAGGGSLDGGGGVVGKVGWGGEWWRIAWTSLQTDMHRLTKDQGETPDT